MKDGVNTSLKYLYLFFVLNKYLKQNNSCGLNNLKMNQNKKLIDFVFKNECFFFSFYMIIENL
jgi:hypothetical protein